MYKQFFNTSKEYESRLHHIKFYFFADLTLHNQTMSFQGRYVAFVVFYLTYIIGTCTLWFALFLYSTTMAVYKKSFLISFGYKKLFAIIA